MRSCACVFANSLLRLHIHHCQCVTRLMMTGNIIKLKHASHWSEACRVISKQNRGSVQSAYRNEHVKCLHGETQGRAAIIPCSAMLLMFGWICEQQQLYCDRVMVVSGLARCEITLKQTCSDLAHQAGKPRTIV